MSDTDQDDGKVTLAFEGYSDDTFGEYGQTNDDYDNCASGEPIVYLVTAAGASLLVVGQYSHDDHEHATGWRVTIQAVDEDGDDAVPPEWNIRFVKSKCPYSPRLAMDVDSGFELVCVTQGG